MANRSLVRYLRDLALVSLIVLLVEGILIYVLRIPYQPVLIFSGFLLIVGGFAGMASGRWSAADQSISPGWAKGNPSMLREDVKNVDSRKPQRSMHYPALLTIGAVLLILYYFVK